jgi:glycosyltransferase involved in cell wall biosynthesis
MWRGETLSVVLPTYNEADSIADCVKGFEQLGIVDEIIVINNNAHPDTSKSVAPTSAREVFETTQGYGAAIRRGLDEADTDLVCICEPDGTFDPDDLLKLLPFLSDSEAVFGSRTVTTFIFAGANMGPFLRWGNWVVAKLVEVLFNTTYLSDVGCTFRVLRRGAVDRIAPAFEGVGSSFGLEMMLHVVQGRIPFVQVPVRYLPRIGDSSVTGEFSKAFALGMEMIGLVLRTRLKRRPRQR